MKVIGQYECGCWYGPIDKRKRLKYCAIHGDDVLDEHPDLSPGKPRKRKKRNETT